MKLTQRQFRRLIEAEVDKHLIKKNPTKWWRAKEIDPIFDLMFNLANDLNKAIDIIDLALEGSSDVSSDVYQALDEISKVMFTLRSRARQY